MFWIETALAVVSVLLALLWPNLCRSRFEQIEKFCSSFVKRPELAIAVIGMAALVLRLAMLPVEPVPHPIVHDEFGYWLAADTFAQGRLTNPTHPMWVHFESFNILQKPTYQCITPPVQGIVLAFGKLVFGHPFWGVWLTIGLMCAAITWMLQGWVPLEWAFMGGALAVLRYAIWTYWGDSYWGGAAGAIGGALVLGALPRIKNGCRVRDSVIMAIGLAILANNRPYDGFVFSLPIILALIIWIFGKQHPPFQTISQRIVIPMVVILIVAGIGTGYYFWRVTGSPFRMPYQIERETYGVAPYLLWQPLRPEPAYRHEVLRRMYVDEEMISYRTFRTPVGVALKGYIVWKFFLGPLLSLPFLALLFTLPYGFSWSQISRRTGFLVITLACVAIGVLSESFYVNAHYSSPVTGLILALVVIALRSVRASGSRGLLLTRAVFVSAVVVFALRASAGPLHIPVAKSIVTGLYERTATDFGRDRVERQLQATPGKHLVIVHYSPNHEPFDEWVYNDADIDGSRVVWAREMDEIENQRLINYFKDRRVWFLDADATPAQVSPYVASERSPSMQTLPDNVKTSAVR